jgi:hypothetical protein
MDSRPRCPLPGGARGQRWPFNLKDCLGEISEIVNAISELPVQLFYEFASENARNAVIELQE